MKEVIIVSHDDRDVGSSNGNGSNGESLFAENGAAPFEEPTSLPGETETVFGLRIGKLSRTSQFLTACSVVFFCYLISGYFQEKMLDGGLRPYTWYLTLMEFGFLSLLSVFEGVVRKQGPRKVPFSVYVVLAVLKVVSISCSNTSLSYLNFPTQVVFKCCEPIPMLLLGILIQRKRFSAEEVCACVCMSTGLVFFTLADSSMSPVYDHLGLLTIGVSMLVDAVISNVQEQTMRTHDSSISEMVHYIYPLGFLLIVFGETVSGQYSTDFFVNVKSPWETLAYGFIVSLMNFIGVNVILFIVRSFGAFVASVVAACRKAITIYLSFVLFEKKFTYQYVWSGLIVAIGVGIHIYTKNRALLDWRHYCTALGSWLGTQGSSCWQWMYRVSPCIWDVLPIRSDSPGADGRARRRVMSV